ncbi:hypothetical protein [Clostridium sp. D43t1_170807_H7]|uniref:hypothetical protein n=1 Tax=Clostridium sp. D43t1_170807_H7 TaxID=2787140 RepID=UPI00189B8D93|nr:hypothetical protein [Clostridium sp. D43t1_170807_H7]
MICFLRNKFNKIMEELFEVNNKEYCSNQLLTIDQFISNIESDLKEDIGEINIMFGLTPFTRIITFNDAKEIYEKFIIILLKIEKYY